MENISSKVLVVDENLNFVFASNEAEAFLLFDSKNSEGKLVGLDPTVEEIDHLGTLFKKIYHFAPVYNIESPKLFVKHQKSNIRIIPLAPSGGKLFFNKFKHVFLFPYHILKLKHII